MIKVKNLWKRYNDNEVLKGLNLEVQKGEILALLGRSGVGKSVLLKHIIGIEKPDKGTIEIEDKDIAKEKDFFAILKNMGMLFQGAALFDSMNIFENVAFYLEQHKNPSTKKRFSKKEIKEKVKEALFMVELEGCEEKMASDLSGGMKKRAAIARLIVYRPSILLYDEPTTGLDPITANHINELIVKIQNELKGTTIIVTHDVRSALLIADRIALHQDGQIAHVARPQEFIKIDDSTIKNFLRGSNVE